MELLNEGLSKSSFHKTFWTEKGEVVLLSQISFWEENFFTREFLKLLQTKSKFLLKSFYFCNRGFWGNKFKDQSKTFLRTQNFCKASLETSWENSFFFEILFEWWGRVSCKTFEKHVEIHASFGNKIFLKLLFSKSKHFSFERFQIKRFWNSFLFWRQRVASPFFFENKTSFENDFKSFLIWKVKLSHSNFVFRNLFSKQNFWN